MRPSLLLTLLSLACTATPSPEDTAPDAAAPTPVEVLAVQRGPISDGFEGGALVEATRRVSVRAPVAGALIELAVEEGAEVRAGQLLARLARPALDSQLSLSRAALSHARSELARAESLSKQGLASAEALEAARFQVREATLKQEVSNRDRELGRVVAPLDGVVVARAAWTGEVVSAGATLYEIADLSALEASLRLPERYLPRLRVGLEVALSAEAVDQKGLKGTVSRISPVVEPRSGTVKVTLALPAQAGLKPGMFLRVRLLLEQRPNALLVPRRALLQEDNQTAVFRIEGAIAAKRLLTLGYADADAVEVREGLREGDQVVVFGQRGLEDGAKVKVVASPIKGAP